MKYYVLLTGAKNNAGDYLIKHSAEETLQQFRPNRELIHIDAWKPLNDKKLKIVNESEALLLTGGPALRKEMYPGIYPLTSRLEDIKVPVITFGIGWKDYRGRWEDTCDYRFSEQSIKLLDKIFAGEYFSSVRDYHSMKVLHNLGYEKVLMTGCPSLYNLEELEGDFKVPDSIDTVLFSVGASFVGNEVREKTQKKVLLFLRNYFSDAEIKVIFHHAPANKIVNNITEDIHDKYREWILWLNSKGIPYRDISGTHQKLSEEYSRADLHVGYRVHAHIYRCSISKPSVLISEDGRGSALGEMLPGGVIKGPHYYKSYQGNILDRLYNKLGIKKNNTDQSEVLVGTLKEKLDWEIGQGFPRISIDRQCINKHFPVMKKFLKQLP